MTPNTKISWGRILLYSRVFTPLSVTSLRLCLFDCLLFSCMFVVKIFSLGPPQKQPLSQGFKSKVYWKVQGAQGRVIQGMKAANEGVFT